MNEVKKLFEPVSDRKSRCALFLSGSGSNALNLLKRAQAAECPFEIVVLVTDNPEKSAAAKLASEYSVPLVAHDIRKFYREHGENSIALTSGERCKLRDIWSDELYEKLVPYQIDFGVLAGFVPLSNIVGKIPCLNVHPGDLTAVDKAGRRIYAGLHFRPVENAILRGEDGLRSSVILAQNYQGSGKGEMDSGPVLGVSAPVKIELDGNSVADLKQISEKRTAPPYKDELRRLAEKNVEKLKVEGDHIVFPQVIEHFVRGDYATDENDTLYFRQNDKWLAVETVEFASGCAGVVRPAAVMPNRKQRSFLLRLIKYYYIKIIRTPGTPEFVARGWALGVAVGCIVPVFCQLLVAIPLSFICRCSKVGAISGTFITTPPTAIFIYPVLIWVGNKVINGNISADAAQKLLKVFNSSSYSFWEKWDAFAALGSELVSAFFIGGVIWAAFMVPLTYFGIKKLVISYRKMKETRRKKLSM